MTNSLMVRPLVTDPDDPNAIPGYVPLNGESQAPKARAKPGPKKGWNKKKRDEFDVASLRTDKPAVKPNACPGCQKPTAAMELPLVHEMLRAARDRLEGASPEFRAHAAESDLMYLAARLDGFCSLGCFRDHQS